MLNVITPILPHKTPEWNHCIFSGNMLGLTFDTVSQQSCKITEGWCQKTTYREPYIESHVTLRSGSWSQNFLGCVSQQRCKIDGWFKLTTYRKLYIVSTVVTWSVISYNPNGDCLRLVVAGTNNGCKNVNKWGLNITCIAWQWDRYLVPENVFVVISVRIRLLTKRQASLYTALHQFVPSIFVSSLHTSVSCLQDTDQHL